MRDKATATLIMQISFGEGSGRGLQCGLVDPPVYWEHTVPTCFPTKMGDKFAASHVLASTEKVLGGSATGRYGHTRRVHAL